MKYHYSVQFSRPNSVEMLLEQLRYAQVLSYDEDTVTVHCPAGIGRPTEWCDSNIRRMATFGLKAISHRKTC